MRRIVRLGIICLCFLLWGCLFQGAVAARTDLNRIPEGKQCQFPGFLPDVDLYVWSMTQDYSCNTLLLVQNIGCLTMENVTIVLWADRRELRFSLDRIAPGEKIFAEEEHRIKFDAWHEVMYISCCVGTME